MNLSRTFGTWNTASLVFFFFSPDDCFYILWIIFLALFNGILCKKNFYWSKIIWIKIKANNYRISKIRKRKVFVSAWAFFEILHFLLLDTNFFFCENHQSMFSLQCWRDLELSFSENIIFHAIFSSPCTYFPRVPNLILKLSCFSTELGQKRVKIGFY